MSVHELPRMRPEPPADLVVLYDGHCAVCTATADFVRARDRSGRIECADLQDDAIAARFPAFGAEQVRAQLHAVDCTGEVFVGVEGLRAIGDRLPRWRRVAWILGIPGVRQVARFIYRLLARNRYAFNVLLRRDPHAGCENGTCAVDWDRLDRDGKT